MVYYPTPEVHRKIRISPVAKIGRLGEEEEETGDVNESEEGGVSQKKKAAAGISAGAGSISGEQSDELECLIRTVDLNRGAIVARAAAMILEGRSFGSWGGRRGRAWVSTLWYRLTRYRAAVHRPYGGMNSQEYSMMVYSLAVLQYQPSEKWMGAFFSGSGALMARQVWGVGN